MAVSFLTKRHEKLHNKLNYKIMGPLGMAGVQLGTNMITGMINNGLQSLQQDRLNRQSLDYSKELTNYNFEKQMEMWEKTGYGPQVEQMKKAGLNPALMYKGAGTGGTTQTATANGGQGQASGNVMMGMDMAQLSLLKAQKENIEADTSKKKAEEQNIGADTEGKGLENAFHSYMRSTSPEGKEQVTIGESVRGRQEFENYNRQKAETQFRLDENDRQSLMNSEVMKRIGAEITKMAAEGKNLEQIYQNLVKEGKLLDAEIEWNKLDISGGNVGKFITNIIKMALKPR